MEVYKQALTKAGNKDFVIKTFPNANHGLWHCESGSIRELYSQWNKMGGPKIMGDAPGYVETMIDWLRARGYATTRQKE